MKIIDLLNKIANGEEVPKKIAIQNEVLIYNEGEILNLQDYYYMDVDEDATWRIWAYVLNDEVEILEEKKIPEKIDVISWDKCIHDVTHKEKELAIEINKTQKLLNQLIDYLKSKGDE